MLRFKQVNEALDTPYKMSLKRDKLGPAYSYRFTTDQGLAGSINFWEQEHPEYDDPMYEINFKVGNSEDETKLGDQFRIFATVMKAIREFIKKENPKFMTLSAKKTSGARGREGLYRKLLDKYLGKTFNIKKQQEKGITFFDIEKKGSK